MLRYFLAAQALRAFSINEGTRKLYRKVGNVVGGRKRAAGLPDHYLTRADGNLRIVEERGLIRDGMRVMEIGTGWAHWEALFVRCFYDVEAVLMDVWDNRQFGGFLRYASELQERLPDLGRPAAQTNKAHKVLDRVLACSSFEEVYDALSFRYALGVEEAYRNVADGSLDLIFSSDVLEHVPASQARPMLEQHHRMLKPGGATAHQIVMTDHLCIYDRKVHPKNYLRYGDRTWGLLYANEVQYINRLQMSDWQQDFEAAGLEVETIVRTKADLTGMRIAKQFAHLDREVLEVAVVSMIGRKPVAN